jgi:hypothetical protein
MLLFSIRSCRVLSQSSTIATYLWTYDLYGPVRNLLMRENPLRGQVGQGLGPGNREFLGPKQWHRAVRRVPLGTQKV